ncbi:reverse transcriptase [Tanacetum coccineum]
MLEDFSSNSKGKRTYAYTILFLELKTLNFIAVVVNTALLAKQGWRLLMNLGAFWGKVLKGLYFPNCGFLAAKRGTHPSWLWSSILHARDLFQGLRWQVGNGRNLSLWTQKWVSYVEGFYVRSPQGPFNMNHKVSDFIINYEWNYEMLYQSISKDEANIIRNISISQIGSTDKLVWHFDAKGHYTIKSGYKQAILAETLSSEELSAAPSTSFWKRLWKILTQPKVKLFLWKVILNCVPTMENLHKRNSYKEAITAFGIVVHYSIGSFFFIYGNSCFATSPLHAELIAIHSACRVACNYGWVGAIVESDSHIGISLSSTKTIPP